MLCVYPSAVMHRVEDCIFCGIVAGSENCFKVYEDDLVVCFMDLFPLADGHTLVVTKEHFENVFEVSESALTGVAALSRRVATAIKKELNPDGLAVYQANGSAAGQTVFHYHMHLIPRREGEGFNFTSRVRGDAATLESHARKLRALL